MPEASALLIVGACVAFGYVLKGATGFAEAIPLASFGHFALPIPEVIAVIAVLDVAGSIGSIRIASAGGMTRDEWWLCVPLLAGVTGGVLVLSTVSGTALTVVYAAALAVAAAWITVNLQLQRRQLARSGRLAGISVGDHVGAAAAGFTGGISGIDGPPLVGMLMVRHPYADIRPTLMRLLLAAAAFRLAALLAAGQITGTATSTAVLMLPLALVTFWVGRRSTARWTPTAVRRVAVAMTLAGILTVLL